MSDNSTNNVAVGKPKVKGAVFRAPAGTTLPTSASATLDEAFDNLGYVSEDGVVNSNSPESEEIKAWGGDTVLTTQTSKPDTFQFTLLEILRSSVMEAVYGSSNVSEASGERTITANSKEVEEGVWVIDMILGKSMKRIVIPSGKISELGDITYKDDEAIGYEITVSAMPDESGNTHYEYIAAVAGANS